MFCYTCLFVKGRGSASWGVVYIQGEVVCIKGRGGGWSASSGLLPRGSASRGVCNNQGEGICIQGRGSASRGRGSASEGEGALHPGGGVLPPGRSTPGWMGVYIRGIWANLPPRNHKSGWYASYSNALLFLKIILVEGSDWAMAQTLLIRQFSTPNSYNHSSLK